MNAGASDDRVTTLIGIATPAGMYDFSAVTTSSKPKFLIHGERDDLAPLQATRRLYGSAAEPKELLVIETADHLFTAHVTEVTEAIDDLMRVSHGP
jgi:alpha/beta superfamily hydrolase